MTSYAVVVASSVGATGFFSLATALKHRSAGFTPHTADERPHKIVDLIVDTARSPLWFGGLLCDVGGLALQVYALHIGPLAVVQPLMISALVMSLVVNHWVAGTRVRKREVGAGLMLVAALAGFLLASGAVSPSNIGPSVQPDHWPATVAGVLAVVLSLICVLIARRLPHGRGTALIGVAVGITYAGTAALIKSITNIYDHGMMAVLSSWQLYAFAAAGVAGLLLSQLAFQSGPLTASLPAIATVDPLLSVVLGVVVYDERLRPGARAAVEEAVFLVLLCAAAIYVSRMAPPLEASPGPTDGEAAGVPAREPERS